MNKEEFFQRFGNSIDREAWEDRYDEIDAIECVDKNSITIKIYRVELWDNPDLFNSFSPRSVVGYYTFTKRIVQKMAKLRLIANKSVCPHILSISCDTTSVEKFFRVELCEELEELLGDKEDILETIDVYAFGPEAYYSITNLFGDGKLMVRFPLCFEPYEELLGIDKKS